jgi:S1-C subfamily serine protease
MKPRCLFWHSVIGFFAFVLMILSGSQTAEAQGARNGLPQITELKAISYQKTNALNTTSLSYQDFASTIRLAQAYTRGNQALSGYHEPVLTRGATGVTVFRNVSPSVVLVVVGSMQKGEFNPAGIGAGVIIDPSGEVLTNWHVINGATAGMIFLKPQGGVNIDDSTAYVAQLIVQDETSDLALLRMVKAPATLHPVALGSISMVQIAEDIHVIGHPEGNLWSYSTGVVSQIRDNYEWSYSDGSKHKAKVLQLQTAINPGNSGGPVLDDQGRLLGLVAMSQEGQNLDYAVAADVIQGFLQTAVSSRTRGGASEGSGQHAEYCPHLELKSPFNGTEMCDFSKVHAKSNREFNGTYQGTF